MGMLLNRLAEKKLLVSDGAWGTMLQAQGLAAGECCEPWNITHPDAVRSVAAAYAAAGADLVLTNTFGGSRPKLEKSGHPGKVAEYNVAGARLSLEGAPNCVIAASVGPTGEFVEPLGDLTESQMEEVFAEQIAALARGGVHAICVETMSALDESCCAIRAVRKVAPALDVICTLTFSPTPSGYRTMMGVSCAQAAEALVAAGADVIGANCGNGVEQMLEITADFRRHTDRPILIHANAGLPQFIDGKTVFRQTPADMSARVRDLVSAGANIIGGCCGTTPQHIAAIREEIDRLRARR